MILMPAVPEDVQQRVLEDVAESPQLAAVSVLDEVEATSHQVGRRSWRG